MGGNRKEISVTVELSTRPRSWALIICSVVLIAVSIGAAIYELTTALEGVPSSDAWLAVGASTLSAVVSLRFSHGSPRSPGEPAVLSFLPASETAFWILLLKTLA